MSDWFDLCSGLVLVLGRRWLRNADSQEYECQR
jgi:hypothetical protein